MVRAAAWYLFGWYEPDPDSAFPGGSDALAWSKTECTNLVAATRSSSGTHPALSADIAIPLALYLTHWGDPEQSVAVGEDALAAVRVLRDRSMEARVLHPGICSVIGSSPARARLCSSSWS
jgi:hypothetical protein